MSNKLNVSIIMTKHKGLCSYTSFKAPFPLTLNFLLNEEVDMGDMHTCKLSHDKSPES